MKNMHRKIARYSVYAHRKFKKIIFFHRTVIAVVFVPVTNCSEYRHPIFDLDRTSIWQTW